MSSMMVPPVPLPKWIQQPERQEWYDDFAHMARLAPDRMACVSAPCERSTLYRVGCVYFALRPNGRAVEVTSVFSTLGNIGHVANVVEAIRLIVRQQYPVYLHAFRPVAEKVWAPFFTITGHMPWDWRKAPLLWRSAYGTPDYCRMQMENA